MSGRFFLFAILLGSTSVVRAQVGDDNVVSQDNNSAAAPQTAPQVPPQAPEDKRVFGVLPNYRTTELSLPFHPVTAKYKLTIAAKDSFDWPSYITGAVFAGIYQLEDQNPTWGQGLKGYAKRYASATGDQIIGNFMTEGIFPAIGHQDPRYFRMGAGNGSTRQRAFHALSSIFVSRMDSGRRMFNFSEWGGNATMAAISNLYYPASQHNVDDNLEKMFVACATDMASNVAKEFWPDVKRALHRHEHKQQQ
jgi:hypothetical protein